MWSNILDKTLGFRYGLLLDDDDPWTATSTTMTASSTGPFPISLLGLDAFKDYSYEAFISTSSSAVYYGGRHRFYTADLTMSLPVYKDHNRAWTQKTYDNFGTHASTTVDGNKLKLYNWGSTSTREDKKTRGIGIYSEKDFRSLNPEKIEVD